MHYHVSNLSFKSIAALCVLVSTFVANFAVAQSASAQNDSAEGASQSSGESKDGQANGSGTSSVAESKKVEFIRISKDANERPEAMQTSIVTYELNKPGFEGVQVDLIGAVHIAHKEYFEQLNDEFRTYDALLYELVADPEVNVPEAGGESRSAVGQIQIGMKDALGLDFQLDHIDYTARNFVHADMSPGEFVDDMKKRGDGFAFMLARMLGSSIAAQSNNSGAVDQIQMARALASDNPELELRKVMSKQFQSMDIQLSGLEDASGRSTLVTERNRKAFDVLEEQLKGGKKKLGIFYGAAHLEDMNERLINDFDAKVVQTRWLSAWRLQ
jgi:hypothetical protein